MNPLAASYIEGIVVQRGIAWRTAGLACAAKLLGFSLKSSACRALTILRTRRLIAVETHQVFNWVPGPLVEAGPLKYKRIGNL